MVGSCVVLLARFEYMSEESEFSSEGEGTWVEWFCSLEDHFWFCEIDPDFLSDDFNLYGIRPRFPKFTYTHAHAARRSR